MFAKPEPNPAFAALEHEVLALWKEKDVFARTVRGEGDFVFYDGPPFATGTPHYGHLLAGTLKDIVPRYQAMRGMRVERRFGWDTHGLPVEMEIEKQLGLNGPKDIHAYGVDNYNEACRAIVLRYTAEWRATVTRMGRWVDFDNDYKTMDSTFMESTWWVFKALWDRGLIHRGYKVMPYSWRLGTPLSNFEANMDYRRVQDPAITITFPLLDRPGVTALAWTTTPWTLPANMALCVGPDITYVQARRRGEDGEPEAAAFLIAESQAAGLLGEDCLIEARCTGSDLVGLRYEPIFPNFPDAAEQGGYRIVADGYVTDEDGTGIVHQAPAYGEDDYRICTANGLPFADPVDDEGRFTDAVPLVAGLLVKEADKVLLRDLKARGRLLRQSTIEHDYPFCWRSGTPLIYKAISTWFVKVTDLRDRLVANNAQTRWVPEYVGTRRFSNWLEDARDWAISRNRFWGTPLPVWVCQGCEKAQPVGAIAELEGLCGEPVTDLHKHHVDRLSWSCGDCGGEMRRVPEVLDCWFESGAMPYAQNHYPFENKEMVEDNLPADFIAEGLDQTRGWFYTLLILSTALFDRPAFRNVIVNGLILAEDGSKMSKSLKNYPDPNEVIETHGADALRAYLINSPVVRAEPMRFSEKGVRDVVRSVILPLWNAYSFFATYASVDGWQPPAPGQEAPLQERALLDRWLISVTQSLVADVNLEMAAYRLYNVIPRVLGFIDHLTNWYIRRSRRRFWRSESDLDKQQAYETLYEVLCLFSRLLAPILPFMAELLYQRLEAGIRQGALDSVHLERFPEAEPDRVDVSLECCMDVLRRVVTLGRNLREQHKLPVRQPLRRIEAALAAGDDTLAWLQSPNNHALVAIVQEELNVKEFSVVADASALVHVSVRANFKTLGRRLGKRMKPVAAAISRADAATIRRWAAGESVPVDGEDIGPDDVQMVQEPVGEGALASDGAVTVRLDTALDAGLRAERLAREIVSKVAAVRKQSGLEVDDRIELSLRSDSELVQTAIAAHRELILAEVLGVGLIQLPGEHETFSAAGEGFAIALRKIG